MHREEGPRHNQCEVIILASYVYIYKWDKRYTRIVKRCTDASMLLWWVLRSAILLLVFCTMLQIFGHIIMNKPNHLLLKSLYQCIASEIYSCYNVFIYFRNHTPCSNWLRNERRLNHRWHILIIPIHKPCRTHCVVKLSSLRLHISSI